MFRHMESYDFASNMDKVIDSTVIPCNCAVADSDTSGESRGVGKVTT